MRSRSFSKATRGKASFVNPSAPASSIPTRPNPSFFRPCRAVGRLHGCKCKHSSSSFRSQAMHPPPPSQGPPPEGRDWRGRKTMEETMRVLTINELLRLTRIELCDLVNRITAELREFPEGSPERIAALVSLRHIRFVLARRDFSP
jgi:hypothetical protein